MNIPSTYSFKEYLIQDDQQGFEPHLSDVRLQRPQRASRRLLEIVSQLGTCAVLQHLDHKREQLLPQTNVVVHHLKERELPFICMQIITV